MSQYPLENWENWVQKTAAGFAYPPAPDITHAVTRQIAVKQSRNFIRSSRLAWAVALLIIVLAGLMAVPPVRAQIAEFLQVGVVRIFLGVPSPTAPAPSTTAPVPSVTPPVTPPVTPLSTGTFIPTILDLAGATTLESAQNQVDFQIPLPTYPESLGDPDFIFLQDLGSPMVVLVWMDPGQNDQVMLSLHLISPGGYALDKSQPTTLEQTSVNGRPALWTTGPYLLVMHDRDLQMRRLIEGHVLIWEAGDLTYRLETGLPLPEAVRIAESIR